MIMFINIKRLVNSHVVEHRFVSEYKSHISQNNFNRVSVYFSFCFIFNFHFDWCQLYNLFKAHIDKISFLSTKFNANSLI